MPIPDLAIPMPGETTHILNTFDAAIAAGHCVYVRCNRGNGRTGTIVDCCLVRHGISSPQALGEIEPLRRGSEKAERVSPVMNGQWPRVRYWTVRE